MFNFFKPKEIEITVENVDCTIKVLRAEIRAIEETASQAGGFSIGMRDRLIALRKRLYTLE
jgi:hypothetical protein